MHACAQLEPDKTPIVAVDVHTNFVVNGAAVPFGFRRQPNGETVGLNVATDKPLKVTVNADRDMSAFLPPKLFLVVSTEEQMEYLHEIPASCMTHDGTRLEITIAPRQLIATKAARDKCTVALNKRARSDDWTVHLLVQFYGGECSGWGYPTVQAQSVSLNMSCHKNLKDFHHLPSPPPSPVRINSPVCIVPGPVPPKRVRVPDVTAEQLRELMRRRWAVKLLTEVRVDPPPLKRARARREGRPSTCPT